MTEPEEIMQDEKREKTKDILALEKHWKDIEWTPEHAGFQLGMGNFYGRHERHDPNSNWPRIHEEVYKAWGLKPFANDQRYVYYKKS